VSPKQVVVIVDGGILSAILQVLTRYSANDPQFPVNDWSLFTGKSHAIGGASHPNGPADGEGTPRGRCAGRLLGAGAPGEEAPRVGAAKAASVERNLRHG
jgi:hypothetical protein